MATSYAAGRYKQLTDPEFLKLRPYWRYVHNDGVLHPRPLHQAWGNARLTLRQDHPFWKTHFPPNGWGCGCRVTPVEAPLGGDATAPPAGWDVPNEKNGQLPGIDKGFGYAPGANTDTSLRQLVQDKLITYPAAIAQALTRDVNRWIDARLDVPDFAREVLADRQISKDLWLGFVDNRRIDTLVGADLRDYIVLAPADAIRHIDNRHGTDVGSQRPFTADDFAGASRWLIDGDVTLGAEVDGMQRVAVRYVQGAEVIESVWELRPGKRNRALSLITAWVKR